MKTKIETKGLFARAVAMLGIAVAAFSVASAYAQPTAEAPGAPEINGISYLNSTRLFIYGVNFGSASGTVTIAGAPFSTLWSPTVVQVFITYCSGGAGAPSCLNTGTSYQVMLKTSAGQIARAWLATIDGKLASEMSDNSVTITDVKINGGSSTAHVAPGATFTISGSFNIVDNFCATCIDVVVVGLENGATPSCLYEGIDGGTPGVTGAGRTTLTAPTAPGIYKILGSFGQNGCNEWDYNVPAANKAIGAIAVY
jgi:hypothetical protein